MKTVLIILSVSLAFTVTKVIGQTGPLMTTAWNQGCYYNTDCPPVGSGGACGKAYTGCNATAIAQICKYYNYPSSGLGNHCNSNNTSHCVDFSSQIYDYNSMPNNLTSLNTEVAKLMYHIGIATDMQWSGTNSVSFFGSTPMKRHLAYSPKMYNSATFMFSTTQELINAVKKELDEGRVVYCKTNSINHFYIIDGYNTSDEFHCNFGWGGVYDGFYPIDNVNITPGNATPHNFIFNIRPLNGNLETANDTIIVPSGGGLNNIEFTSLQNWTMSASENWISLNQTSGVSGYYAPGDGISFNSPVNNDTIRYGYILIDNSDDVDTIVVAQKASPLVVNPDTLLFTEAGGYQDITVDWFNWSNWNATSSDVWITISPSSGSGSGIITVTLPNNISPTNREGKVIVTGGSYTDTIVIYQEPTLNLKPENNPDENNITVFPNPCHDFLFVETAIPLDSLELILSDIYGRVLLRNSLTSSLIDLKNIPNGVYLISLFNKGEKISQRKIIKN